MKEVSFWLTAKKKAFNVAKTEVILKPCDTDLRPKLCRKRVNKTKYVRCLGINTDEKLTWKIHVNGFVWKLNWANAVLAKVRHFVNNEILRSTYFAIFHSHLNYVCKAWGLIKFPQQKVSVLQKNCYLKL